MRSFKVYLSSFEVGYFHILDYSCVHVFARAIKLDSSQEVYHKKILIRAHVRLINTWLMHQFCFTNAFVSCVFLKDRIKNSNNYYWLNLICFERCGGCLFGCVKTIKLHSRSVPSQNKYNISSCIILTCLRHFGAFQPNDYY